MKVNRTAKAKFSSPLVGSVNDNIPVSADVHLYADPHTILNDTPLLYADCEGLEGGESPPKNEVYKMRDRASENGLPHENPSEYGRHDYIFVTSRNRSSKKQTKKWKNGDCVDLELLHQIPVTIFTVRTEKRVEPKKGEK